jgi:hypothetical protein
MRANPEGCRAGPSGQAHPRPEQQAREQLPSVQSSRFRHIIRRLGGQLTHDGHHLEFAAAVDLGKAMFALSTEFDGGFGEPRQTVKRPRPEHRGRLPACRRRTPRRPSRS